MAGIKLSELATTTIIDGSELLTILQDGMNRNTTIDTVIGPTHRAVGENTVLIYSLSATLDTSINNLTGEVSNLDYELSTFTTNYNTDLQQINSDIQSVSATSSAGISLLETQLNNVDNRVTSVSATHVNDIQQLTTQIESLSQDASQPSVSVSPIFITNITNPNGLIQKTYKPDTVPSNHIIDSVTVDDNSSLKVYFEWDGPDDDWMGQAYINNTAIPVNTVSRYNNTRRFYATYDVTNTTSITAAANGGSHIVPVELLGAGPAITNVTFGSPPTHGGYQPPFFLDGDSVQVTVEFDTSDVSSISLYSGGSYATQSVTDMNVTVTGTPPTATFTATVDTTSSSVGNFPIRISAKNSFGTQGNTITSTATIPAKQGPDITSITFGNYPGSQTELKNNDQISVTIGFDTNNVSLVDFYNSSTYANDGSNYNVNVTNQTATISMRIGASNTTVQNLPVRCRARGGSSNYGSYITSTSTLAINNAYPQFNSWLVTYPFGQEALKGTESAGVTLNVTNQGQNPVYTYSTPNSQVSVPDPNTYSVSKVVTCTNPGTYNISSNNYRLVVTRTENDATSTYNNNIKIADVAPTLSVSHNAGARMRSGGNDGTSVQTYQVTLNSNQQLQSFTMDTDTNAGTFDGTWTESGNNWRRNIKISDDDDKGTFNWQNATAVNLAGISQSSLNSGSTYTLGGFVSRTLYVASQGWQVSANVEAVTYSKVRVNWDKKSLTNQRPVGDTTRPQIAAWSLDRLSPAPITVNILDSGATNASSVQTTLTLEELA